MGKWNWWAMLCHLGPILLAALPLNDFRWPVCWLGLLAIWGWKRKSDPEVNEHVRQSMNWQAVFQLYVALLMLLMYWAKGLLFPVAETPVTKVVAALSFFALLALAVVALVYQLRNAYRGLRGRPAHYPISLPLFATSKKAGFIP